MLQMGLILLLILIVLSRIAELPVWYTGSVSCSIVMAHADGGWHILRIRRKPCRILHCIAGETRDRRDALICGIGSWNTDNGTPLRRTNWRVSLPMSLGLVFLGVGSIRLPAAAAVAIALALQFLPLDQRNYVAPAADEVVVLPGSILGAFVGDTSESPEI